MTSSLRACAFGCLLSALCVLVSPADALAVTLARDGKPAATIVVPKAALDAKPYQPSRYVAADEAMKVRLAAEEFQRVVEKMSGAKLPIVGDDQPPPAGGGAVVLIGRSARTEPLKLDIPAGLTAERVEEGLLVHGQGDTLVLAGNDAGPYHGTFYAVSAFLERLGVRWYMPGAFGEIIPNKPTVEVADLSFRETPDFRVRFWVGNLAPELQADEAIWRLHNKAMIDESRVLAIPGDSHLRNYMPDAELIKTRPEIFAKKADGTPDPHMPSMTHPEAPKLVAEKVKAAIKAAREKDPTFNSLGFAPDDGLPMDLSKEAVEQSAGFTDLTGREGVIQERSISEEWFRFMNKVTEEVVKEYPDFIITTNGYANRNMPPEGVALHPNMGVMFAAIWSDLMHAYDDPKSWQTQLQGQMLKRWTELCPRVFIYGYNYPMIVSGLTPLPVTRRLARDVPQMKKWGVAGFEDEQAYSWMAHGTTTMYVRARLYWDADADVKALLNDYFTTWYGPAAKPAAAYWDAIEAAIENTKMLGHEDRVLPYVYTDELLEALERHTKEAESLATAEPYATRVRVDRLILDHLKAYMAMNRAEFVGQYDKALAAADEMFKQREQINKISAFLHYPETRDPAKRYFSGAFYWNLLDRKDHYQKLLDMTTGKTGTLIVQAPKDVKFSLDPADLGRLSRWYLPDFDRSKWRLIDTTAPFYIQGDGMMDDKGVQYIGFVWYVFELDVPESAIGKPVHVYAPIVADEAWVWTNGQYTGHRPYFESYIRPLPMEFDVTKQVKAGKNVIGVRVSTSMSRTQVAEGFQGPLFLYSPAPGQPTKPQ